MIRIAEVGRVLKLGSIEGEKADEQAHGEADPSLFSLFRCSVARKSAEKPLYFVALTVPVAGIAAIGEHVPQPRIERADRGQDLDRAVAILDVGGMNPQTDEIALGVGDDMALAALVFLPASKPLGPPHSVVFTDWLSMTPADGLASRPTFSRSAVTSMWLICASNPWWDQA